MEYTPSLGGRKAGKSQRRTRRAGRDTDTAHIRKKESTEERRSPVCRIVVLFSIHEMRRLSMCILHNATVFPSFFERICRLPVISCESGTFSVVRKESTHGNNWLTQRVVAWYTIQHKGRASGLLYRGIAALPAGGFSGGGAGPEAEGRKDGKWESGYCFPGRQRHSSLP